MAVSYGMSMEAIQIKLIISLDIRQEVVSQSSNKKNWKDTGVNKILKMSTNNQRVTLKQPVGCLC